MHWVNIQLVAQNFSYPAPDPTRIKFIPNPLRTHSSAGFRPANPGIPAPRRTLMINAQKRESIA